MITNIDKLTKHSCSTEKSDKVCRSRGGESCAFDGAMIVLQPIADAAHIIHGPIACCGNSWEGRGALSSKGNLSRVGFTTNMGEMDIVYGSEERLYEAIVQTYEKIRPNAIFVYATCVSGLIGEDIEAVCKKAEAGTGLRVIPVNAPGFVGPKNLGNRIAGEVLLEHVIGTGEPPAEMVNPPSSYQKKWEGGTGDRYLKEKVDEVRFINLIGEYNIAGDLWLVEPLLKDSGIRVLSRITGDSTFEEITYAHRANLNVVVCSRALINIAKEMERKYRIPFVEVSFFGKTQMTKALRLIASKLEKNLEEIIEKEERLLDEKLKAYKHLKGKKAVLYTGGVKSWSFISALLDLGIEIVAVGTKKSTFEDEEKMKEILGENALFVEDVAPKNLLRLMKDGNADILIAGGRNQYLAVKEGYPFVDVNQERHTAYAGYDGLINLAEQINNSLKFYNKEKTVGAALIPFEDNHRGLPLQTLESSLSDVFRKRGVVINPLKHSQSIGAAIAFQGIHKSLPIIHGAQGCTFLGKVLLTKHFREPIALASTKLFTEDVVMGSEEKLIDTVNGFIEKNKPAVIGILTSGLSEVKGDNVQMAVKALESEIRSQNKDCSILYIPTPDYEGGLETGYANAVVGVIETLANSNTLPSPLKCEGWEGGQINVLCGSHLTPADFTELREIIESFGLRPILLPDLSALDGSRQGFSALSEGGTTVDDIKKIGSSEFTIAIGSSMERAAQSLKERFGIEYRVFESIAGLNDTDVFIETLFLLSRKEMPARYERQRRVLVDAMRDAHFYFTNKKVCIALEKDLATQIFRCLNEMGAEVITVDVNSRDLFSINGSFDLLIANSHAEDAAKRLQVPLYQMGFPVFKIMGYCSKITMGYRGTVGLINDISNLLMNKH